MPIDEYTIFQQAYRDFLAGLMAQTWDRLRNWHLVAEYLGRSYAQVQRDKEYLKKFGVVLGGKSRRRNLKDATTRDGEPGAVGEDDGDLADPPGAEREAGVGILPAGLVGSDGPQAHAGDPEEPDGEA